VSGPPRSARAEHWPDLGYRHVRQPLAITRRLAGKRLLGIATDVVRER
jgi:hypothetical protein